MAIIDVVKWDEETHRNQAINKAQGKPILPMDQVYAWKFDSTELSTWTQLIVHESQEAVVFRGGAMDGPFGPGRHVLKTENLPVIGKLLNLPFGRSPFTAEVWYTNRAIPLDVQWGTREPIRIQDSKYGIVIPVSAHGQYAVQIENSRKFLVKLVGTMSEFNKEKLKDYFRGLILTIAKTTIAKKMGGNTGLSVLEIATQLTDISDAIKAELNDQLEDFGLKLVNFFVSHIDVNEDDPSIKKLREALAKKAEMDIVGFNYQQERSFNAMEGAAGYTGAQGNTMNQFQNRPADGNIGASMIGLGVGMGVGVPMGQTMGQQFTGAMNTAYPNAVPPYYAPPPVAPYGTPGMPPAAAPAAPAIDPNERIRMLKELAQLRDQGVLTPEEFEAEKRKILGQ
ncbi:SPFH domain-containing protein [Polynucleobacter sp. MWH-Spelu-300-X4]|uniref:SPFH domain-containing protein n=1 Tax=Polynucleobacter sp. MWH-Spelu-300-X4 TaxID=2689109 RepID=UPI001BFD0A3D|nr:SPFH domain-containing protein [Polynucleobacter sp. MWH-Spelu-300-X4]QWD80518.1 SPFH domain-containing protein [Polynucleobacter sp. MWH-Spelu-300-X4]